MNSKIKTVQGIFNNKLTKMYFVILSKVKDTAHYFF